VEGATGDDLVRADAPVDAPLDRAVIARVAEKLGATVAPEAAGKLETWLSQLLAWNTNLDLTAARTQAELYDLMLADAAVLAARVPQGVTMVDVGSGAGAPGLALAVLRPDLRVTLVEPNAKRVAFLRTALAAIGRNDVALLRMRAAELRIRWDVAMARATFAPPDWLEEGAEIVRGGGSVWVLLAKEEPPQLQETYVDEDVSYVWPCTGVARRAVRYVVP
jgi:16S rRNA (guanine527-N7)-methyltransferase